MYRTDAGRHFAECAEIAPCADGADGTDETAFTKSTWILPDVPKAADFSAPIAREVLAEIDCRIAALAGQLDALTDLTRDGGASDDFDYLLEQFRILTFTVGGTMSRQMITDADGIPVRLLQSLLSRFVELADRLCVEFGRGDRRDNRVPEIQRQSRSVSQKLAIVIERLCGSKANAFRDDLEAMGPGAIAPAPDRPRD